MLLRSGALAAAAALAVAAPAAGAVITRHAVSASYDLTLEVGPTETMYTVAQEKAKHPTSGEVMLGNGSMMAGMSMSGMTRHLEVHIYARTTGKVVMGLSPSITLTDTSSKSMMSIKVPVVEMEGIGEGSSDYHYGNNVTLTAGAHYDVLVKVGGQQAAFSFTAS